MTYPKLQLACSRIAAAFRQSDGSAFFQIPSPFVHVDRVALLIEIIIYYK
jgi:hypothetical protein